MKRFTSIFLSSLLAALAFVGFTASSSLANDQTGVFYSTYESRSLTEGTVFNAEAEDQSVIVVVRINTGSSAIPDSADVYRVAASLTAGGTVVSTESVDFWNYFMDGGNSHTAIQTAEVPASSSWVQLTLRSGLRQSVDYAFEVDMFKNGTVLTEGTDYVIQGVIGSFYRHSESITTDGDENTVSFSGEACVPAATMANIAEGTVLRVGMADSAGNSYQILRAYWVNSGSYNWTYQETVTVVAADKVDGIKVDVMANSIVSANAGLYDPSISIKVDGEATELAADCVTSPSTAPTLEVLDTGIKMNFDLAGADYATCFLAPEDSPNFQAVARPYFNQSEFMMFTSSASCAFEGIKRGNYVGWYHLEYEIGRTEMTSLNGRTSFSPTTATAATYAGGNGTFPEFSGSDGGSGQGSLVISEIDNEYFDFGTLGSSNFGPSNDYGKSSDGNGGLLIASVEGAENKISIRRLTPSGQDMTFASDGTAEVSVAQTGNFSQAPQIGWYGVQKDKWVALQRSDGFYGSSNETSQLITGTYSGGQTNTANIGRSDLAAFCQSYIDADNRPSSSYGYIEALFSLPTDSPTLLIRCSTERNVNSKNYYSNVYFVGTVDANGDLILKYSLSAQPTDSEPCSSTNVSKANSGATGSDVLIASYQVRWLPSSSNGGCFSGGGGLPASDVVSRDIYKILADTQTTSVAPIADVVSNSSETEPYIRSGSYSYGSGMGLIVSGTNLFMLNSTYLASNGPTPPNLKYSLAVFDGSSFGDVATWPLVNVGGETEFRSNTSFSQIADFSEEDNTSVLLLRQDQGGTDGGTTAARVDVSDGSVVSYRQMVATSNARDGFSLAVGNSSGNLNFFGIKSRAQAVLGTWQTTGELDPGLAALPINQGSQNTGVSEPLSGPPGPSESDTPAPAPAAAPYTGPVLDTPAITSSVAAGGKVVIPGSNLSGVSAVQVGGVAATVVVNSDGELEITVPSGLAAGTYDLVVVSSSGTLTVQNAITVSGSLVSESSGPVTPSTKRMENGTAKIRVFNAAGAGKIQIYVNGKEIAWVNTSDVNDPKLFNGYLVRTVELAEGKNVIEVFVDGERIRRVAYAS